MGEMTVFLLLLFLFSFFRPRSLRYRQKRCSWDEESGNRIPRLQRPFARSATAYFQARACPFTAWPMLPASV
ncbi:hypothetical protein LY78DRAFT_659127, partial [Colletotrichum sublineola]